MSDGQDSDTEESLDDMARNGRSGRSVTTSGQRSARRGGELNIGLDESDRVGTTGRSRRPKASPERRPAKRSGGFLGLFGRKGKARTAPPAQRSRKTKRRARRGGVFGLIRVAMRTTLVIGLVGLVAIACVLGYVAAQLPSVTSWAVPDRPPNIRILAVGGDIIANRGDTGGEAVRLADLPAYVPQAVIAIEDRRFYSHFGVDPVGLVRAAVRNVTAGDVVQGGSTLTQQLAKNLFLNPERTMERKIQEVVLALWLEARFSKDQIIEMYLNRVYLGAGAYGLDAAAHRYFGKPASKLTLLEAAVIAGLLKAPSRYAPTTSPEAAVTRAKVVLAAMHEAGFITASQEQEAAGETLTVAKQVAEGSGGYVADWVADLVPGFVGAVDGDIVVQTTIDMKLQGEAAAAVKNGIDGDGKALGVHQGALVSMTTDGAIRALVGGRDYQESQYDRAVNSRRQPGSSFKPFVYLTALEYGLIPETVRVDGPINIRGWKPENYAHDYQGPVTLQRALALSLNTISAQLTDEVGAQAVVDTAHRLGISSPIQANPSIALGTSEVSLLEMTGAFAPFANGGTGVIPYVIESISSTDGRVLYQRSGTGPGQVIQPQYVAMMNSMLKETLESGTGKKAAINGWQAAGKTGTSQDWRDAWFVGYTSHLVTGVWFGNDNNSPTRKASGGNLPAAVWSAFMRPAHQGIQVAALPGDYQFRDPAHFAADQAPAQDIVGPNGRYDEYVDRYERLDQPPPEDGAVPDEGTPPPDWRDNGQDNGDGQVDPNLDRRFLDDPGVASQDPNYDPDNDPNYDPRNDPNYDPRFDPNVAGNPNAGPVPPGDIAGQMPVVEAPIQEPVAAPPPRRGLFGRIFGGG